MGKKFLIDTNVLIDFQLNVLSEKGHDYVIDIIDNAFKISFVSYVEFLGYPAVSKAMEDFVTLADVIGVDQAIIDQTIALRKVKKIKLPDAIIAATAIAHNLTLISRNVRDFKNIPNLETVNPYDL